MVVPIALARATRRGVLAVTGEGEGVLVLVTGGPQEVAAKQGAEAAEIERRSGGAAGAATGLRGETPEIDVPPSGERGRRHGDEVTAGRRGCQPR
jgi:hypothetical protein